jgi:hypothetical protein
MRLEGKGISYTRWVGLPETSGRGVTVGFVCRPASERVKCDRNIVPCIFSLLLQCFIAGAVLHRLGRVDLHTVGCLCDMPNERLPQPIPPENRQRVEAVW